MSFERVAVVGAGLIGGSFARRLVGRGVDVVVVDPAADDAVAAVVPVAAAVPPSTDLVVLAQPLHLMDEVMAAVARDAPRALVIDVGSAKGSVSAAAARAGLAERFVGTHPMAGTERSGFVASSADLLVGATWAVTRPVGDLVRFLLAHFDATVMLLDDATHDAAVARISHVPHLMANALLGLAESEAARYLAAGSFRDATRVAGRDPVRTANMVEANRDAVLRALDGVVAELGRYREDVAAGVVVDRLARVSAGERSPEPTWRRCDDLDALLAGWDPTQGPTLVRSGEDVDVHVVAVLEDGPVAGA